MGQKQEGPRERWAGVAGRPGEVRRETDEQPAGSEGLDGPASWIFRAEEAASKDMARIGDQLSWLARDLLDPSSSGYLGWLVSPSGRTF